jgi:hypothetical protein
VPTDLKQRLDRAVGAVEPRPVDTDIIWRRGRRQRRVRQATPILAVLVLVALGAGVIASLPPATRTETGPLDGIEDGRNTVEGWTVVEPGGVVTTDTLVVASRDDVDVVTVLLGHPNAPYALDVRADGAVVTVLHDLDRGGIVVRHPGDPGWVRLGMPVPFLEDEAGYAVHTVQWGPDGRIYLTGTAPAAATRGRGLTQVAVLEEDGTVVGVRENDDGQTNGFLFTDGYAWQRQVADPDTERWQPVVELGGRVLPMPEQRAGDREDVVAPDGMSLTYELEHEGPRFVARAGGEVRTWRSPDQTGVGVWPQASVGLRLGATVATRPAGGPLGWLNGGEEPDGVVVHAVRRDGRIAAVHLPAELVEEPWSLVNGTQATVSPDGRLHWWSHTPDGPKLFRYRHPVP